MFLALKCEEAFYGGAAGPGKSEGLLMAATQYVHVPAYAALLLRRSYTDLSLPGALMDRAHEWWDDSAAKWDQQAHTWRFPSGATITFGYLDNPRAHFRYKSAEFQFIGFDELTQFPEEQYGFMASRLRRLKGMDVPLRLRSGSNPGDLGHEWVQERFVINGDATGRRFIPATMEDNLGLDIPAYERQLEVLKDTDPVAYRQMRYGDWLATPTGIVWTRRLFEATRYHLADEAIRNTVRRRMITVDTAFKDSTGADYTAAAVWELWPDYSCALRCSVHERREFPDLVAWMEQFAAQWDFDGRLAEVVIEDRGSGTSLIQTLRKTASTKLRGILQEFQPITGKVERAKQASLWAARGCVWLPHPSAEALWLNEMENELFGFGVATHDDLHDVFAMGLLYWENLLEAGWRARGALLKAA